MAVKGPNARIIGLELQCDITARSQHLSVAAMRIVSVDNGCAIPFAVAFVQELERVAVEMERLFSEEEQQVSAWFFHSLLVMMEGIKCSHGKYL